MLVLDIDPYKPRRVIIAPAPIPAPSKDSRAARVNKQPSARSAEPTKVAKDPAPGGLPAPPAVARASRIQDAALAPQASGASNTGSVGLASHARRARDPARAGPGGPRSHTSQANPQALRGAARAKPHDGSPEPGHARNASSDSGCSAGLCEAAGVPAAVDTTSPRAGRAVAPVAGNRQPEETKPVAATVAASSIMLDEPTTIISLPDHPIPGASTIVLPPLNQVSARDSAAGGGGPEGSTGRAISSNPRLEIRRQPPKVRLAASPLRVARAETTLPGMGLAAREALRSPVRREPDPILLLCREMDHRAWVCRMARQRAEALQRTAWALAHRSPSA